MVHLSAKKRRTRQREGRELLKDLDSAQDAIRRYADSTWWDWSEGSTLHFWKWHPEYQKATRDGTKMMLTDRFEPYMKIQVWSDDPNHLKKMRDKLLKVVDRGHISGGPITSLTGFFAVPKGESDIRMVYDATKCGLNDTIWAPTFLLPTIDTTLE